MDAAQIQALRREAAFPHGVSAVDVIETHISWVVLAGEFAYKIKKPVDFGFLDFSTLERRRACCARELTLNQRFSQDIYLDVVEVFACGDEINLCGRGNVIDVAVKMRRFDQQVILRNQFRQHLGDVDYWRRLGDDVATLHQSLPSRGDIDAVAALRDAIQQNVDQCRPFLGSNSDIHHLEQIELESMQAFCCNERLLRARLQQGFVRECHGDLHLGNLLHANEKFVAFDCIEFNTALSTIDVASDLAFLLMDLQSQQAHAESWLLLNAWLERSGDYAVVSLLPLLIAYRAMVRAKVALLSVGVENRSRLSSLPQYQDYLRYTTLAMNALRPRRPALVIMHGISGSGKTTVARNIAARYGAFVIRSDVERKRLFGLDPLSTTPTAGQYTGIYTAEATAQTFARMRQLALQVLEAGAPCIVDATFLDARHRTLFAELAAGLEVPFFIVHTHSMQSQLEQRVLARADAAHDASEAGVEVVRSQAATYIPLAESELAFCIDVDSDKMGIKGCPELPLN